METRHRIAEVLNQAPDGQSVLVCGWVRTRRDSKGGFSFLEINDGSSIKGIQAVADQTLPNYQSEILNLLTGSSVSVTGTLVASQGREQGVEVRATEVRILGQAGPEFPLQKKRHSFEFLRGVAHLRPRTNTFGAVARVRNALAAAIHHFFQSRGFLLVHTPILTGSDCEGAGAMFKVAAGNAPEGFFGKPAYLTVSGQLEGEAYACALGDIYTFGPTFRAENSNTSRHLSEFWMVEPEMAFCDLEGDARIAEAFLKETLSQVLAQCPADLAFLNQYVDTGLLKTLEGIVHSPFERLTYTQAVEILRASGEPFAAAPEWGKDLQTEHERYLTEKKFLKPVIVTDYPRAIKSFYMRVNDDGKTVRGMDVLLPRIGEIIGGSEREERPELLLQRIAECGLNPADYQWYLDLRRFGTVPHAGFGLGFERLVQLATGMENIRDVIPFPRAPGLLEF